MLSEDLESPQSPESPTGVRTQLTGDVTTVILDRPHARNAVDRTAAEALADAFRDFDANPDAKVAVLWGAGGHFCSGADLTAVASGDGNRMKPTGDGPMGPTRLQLSKPVIAAVAGYAVAGGMELALWCDLRVVEETATFGIFCRRFGVPLVDGGTVRLPQLIGASRAMDLILTGRPVPASEAFEIGIANRLVPAGQARQRAEELARQLAALPQTCLRNDRRSLLEGLGQDTTAAMAREFELGMETVASGETRDGAQRFRGGEGRHGNFATKDSTED